MEFKTHHHLHMLFFPFMMPSHTLPLVDIAKLFAARGAQVTILATPANAAVIRPIIDDSIHLHIIPFPYTEFGLPEGCENRAFDLPHDLPNNFFRAVASLRQPFDSVLGDLRPDCVVSDMFLPWTYHIAAARGIPRLVFHGTNNFTFCASDAYERCNPLLGEAESFVLPGLPHRIEMLKTQVIEMSKLAGTPMEFILETYQEMRDVESKNYGAVMNSFYELEPEYVEPCREVMGRRSWNIGPVSLYNHDLTYKSTRGLDQLISPSEYLEWLDEKPTGSIVYMCFGSGCIFLTSQMKEMALGLEASGHSFVWVVRSEGDDWVPEGYEERIKGRGMLIRGWAPQLLILNHAAVGGFVTHCGWNSSLEGICAGMPMATWPLFAEQFYNEKFLVEVLKVGVMVGSKVCHPKAEARPVIKADAVEAAVRRLMGDGDEATERRRRAKELAAKARRAVDKGGSSYEEIDKLMHELAHRRKIVE